MKINSILITGLILLLFVPIANAGVTNFTTETGSNFINWSWNFSDNTTNVALFLDGQFVTNTSLTSFIISDLNPREQHILVLQNNTNVTESTAILKTSSIKTFYPHTLFYLILVFAIGFLLLEILLKDEIITLIVGVLCFIMSALGFYLSFLYYFSILSYLMLGIAVIAFLWCLMAAFSLLSKGSSSEEDINI